MIGKIVIIKLPYFDDYLKKTRFKARPGLVIGNYGLIDTDLIILPISKITHSQNIHSTYDIAIDPIQFPNSKLSVYSYIRTHKQITVNRSSIAKVISDFKKDYPDKYLEVISCVEDFDDKKVIKAI